MRMKLTKFTFLIPVIIMIILVIDTNNHPAIRFFGFWLPIPIYCWIKGRKYLYKNINKKAVVVGNDKDYQEYNNQEYGIQPTVSHIQRETTTTNTNTTVTTETIYFKEAN